MAKAPDPRRVRAQQIKQAVDEVRWVVEVDDEKDHVFRLSDVTALDVGALRREAQMTVREMVLAAEDEQLDAQAAIVWMARRQAGETKLRFQDVAEEFTLGQLVYVRDERGPEDESEAEPDPPPSGGSSGG